LHETNDYAAWAGGRRGTPYRSFENADELRASGLYRIVTPDEAVVLIDEQRGLTLKPLMGGLDPALGWECLELFDGKVRPRLGRAAATDPIGKSGVRDRD
jgi:hypothetical protein